LVEIEGNSSAVLAMEEWLGQGPSTAKVTSLEISEGEEIGYPDFLVLR